PYFFTLIIRITKLKIMVIPFSNTKLRVPQGFQSLLVGLSTETLRSQPRDIHEFAADYFEKLLRRRGKHFILFDLIAHDDVLFKIIIE
ncbi:unnamed protein product, partial [Rotaria magnacalcarata]